ncbi:MAG TPA: TIM-barrel domain-containing protein [Acidobacteriaceae bacterium]
MQGISAGAGGLLLELRFPVASALASKLSEGVSTGPAVLELKLTAVNDNILRVTVAAAGEPLDRLYGDGSLVARVWPDAVVRAVVGSTAQTVHWSGRVVEVYTDPLRVTVRANGAAVLQELRFEQSPAQVQFLCGDGPVYGLGSGAHALDRRGTSDAMKNGQIGDDLKTYGAHVPVPWLMGSNGWGLFFHEPQGSFAISSETATFKPNESARGYDIFLLAAETPAQLLRAWAELVGFPHLPPLWTLGYQQSHRTLASREEILQEAKTFREKQLPCDTLIYLGTGFCPSGWNTGHGSFSFNQAVFPDPEKMVVRLHEDHFKVVLHVVNPPVNLFGKVSGTGVVTEEPANAATYWSHHAPLDRMGIDGWWPDEGDPLPAYSRLVRNEMYWDGERQERPNDRPFALHRNGYAGLQRYGWLWSGDVFSTWKTLAAQVMEGINIGLSGIPYWGTDIGGFVPTRELTAELFVRWFQFGAFCPLFRGHGRTWKLRLPWGWATGDYGPPELTAAFSAEDLPKPEELHNIEVEKICRKYLNTRYRLLPYIYSAVSETHATGIPLIRGLWLHFPGDTKARAVADEYLFGPALLVAPVLEPGATKRAVYLPEGTWWDFWTQQRITGGQTLEVAVDLETMPVFVRAGTTLATGPIKQFVSEASAEPITLTVYPGDHGVSSLYEDDGQTFAYEQGDFSSTELRWNDAAGTLLLRSAAGKRVQNRRFFVGLAGSTRHEIAFGGAETKVQLR